MSDFAGPNLTERVASLWIHVGEPLRLGTLQGRERRIVPILGGRLEGAGMAGRVLAGGSDMQMVRPDGVLEIDANFVIDFGSDGQVMAHNQALRRSPAQDGASVYFRGTFRFQAPEGRLSWLNDSIFVASGRRHGDQVELELFRVT